MITNTSQLERVGESMEKMKREAKQVAFDISISMSEMEIIKCFNDQSIEFFTLIDAIVKEKKMEKEFKVSGYKFALETAIRSNFKLPIDKFTLTILEYAPEIYNQNDEYFLNMAIPDKDINVAGEFGFGLLKSNEFKKEWKTLSQKQQSDIGDQMILLTTYAHAYFYKVLSKVTKTTY